MTLVLALAVFAGEAGARKPLYGDFAKPGAEPVQRYVEDCYDLIMQDLATGDGVHLDAMATVLACPKAEVAQFKRTLREQIRSQSLARLGTPEDLLRVVVRAIETRKPLADQCRNLPQVIASLPPSSAEPLPVAKLALPRVAPVAEAKVAPKTRPQGKRAVAREREHEAVMRDSFGFGH